jgi:hypothetical protein
MFGWEAWTRTRIARFRVWSPTNWTTSQQVKSYRVGVCFAAFLLRQCTEIAA